MPGSTIHRAMTGAEWAVLLTLSVLWGGSFFFVGVAVDELPPLTLVLLRVALAAVALWAVVALGGARVPRDRRVWGAFLGMGLLNNAVPFTLIVWGQTHVASGVAAILNATAPLFTVLVAHALIADERLTPGRGAGVCLGLLGVGVLIGGGALRELGAHVPAQLACLGAALAYALAGVFGRRFAAFGVTPTVTAAGQVTASSLALAPLALLVDRPWTLDVPSAATVAAVAGLALLSTALAYVLYFRLLATAGVTNLLLVTFLIPVSAIGLGVLLLDEALRPEHLAGMALVGLGLAAIDGRPWQAARRSVGRRSGTTSARP